MAVKHGWLFNSLAAVELLTQFLIHVVINLVFVSLLSKYKYGFFLRRVCRLFVVSPHLQLAAGRELSEQPQHKTSSVPSACCAHGYCIWENVGFVFPNAKYLWKVLQFILVFETLGKDNLWPSAGLLTGTACELSPAAFPPELVGASAMHCIFCHVQL